MSEPDPEAVDDSSAVVDDTSSFVVNDASSFVVNDNSDVYYSSTYWNDFDVVRRRLNETIGGDPDRTWMEHLAGTIDKPFERALILNCGNGNIERGLHDNGIVKEAVGIDYAEPLLAEARAEAAAQGKPLTYHQMDTNTAAFPEGPFDVVVNFAAGHHIARIDKVFRRLCELLPDDGWFICHDYVGPHRNQYRYDAWNAAWQVNESLPGHLRQDMTYPHLPTMLASDPTEAIHSELIMATFDRYFTVVEETPLGGALAYPLLTHNDAMFEAEASERDAAIETILEADRAWCTTHPDDVLFSYFTGRPNKAVLAETELLAEWSAEEDEREARAAANGGEYYPHTAIQAAYLALEDQRVATLHARIELEEARSHLDRLVGTFPVKQIRQVTASSAVTKIRANPTVAKAERKLRP